MYIVNGQIYLTNVPSAGTNSDLVLYYDPVSGLVQSYSNSSSSSGGGISSITLTGDITGTGTGTVNTTLATVNSNAGSYGLAGARIPVFTVNSKGLITSIVNTNIDLTGYVDTNAASFTTNKDSDQSTDKQTITFINSGNYANRLRLADNAVTFTKMRKIPGRKYSFTSFDEFGHILGSDKQNNISDSTESNNIEALHMVREYIPFSEIINTTSGIVMPTLFNSTSGNAYSYHYFDKHKGITGQKTVDYRNGFAYNCFAPGQWVRHVGGEIVENIDIFIPTVVDGTVVLRYKQYRAGKIDSISIKTTSGTVTGNVRINTVSVSGMSSISITSSDTTIKSTSSNMVAVGDTIDIVLSSNSSAINLQGSIRFTY